MSTSEELRVLSLVQRHCAQVELLVRAADEIESLQAKLDAVRALCADKNFQFASTLAREVLAAIDKETNDG